MESSGERLRKAMQEKGWSKKRLVRESGLSYATITRMLSGNRVGYVDSWMTVCDTMGIFLSDVLQEGYDGRE